MNRFAYLAVITGALAGWVATAAAATPPASVNRQLSTVLPQTKFNNVAFSEAIDFLRDLTGANIHVNWKAIEADDIPRDTPVNLDVRRVTLRKVLTLLLAEAGGGRNELAFYVDEGVIEITTRELADRKLVTRVYPVRDLLFVVPNFTTTRTDNDNNGNNSSNNNSNSGYGNSQNNDSSNTQAYGSDPASQARRAAELIRLITTVVQPDVWQARGGSATITYFNGSLIVTAPRSVHEALVGSPD